MSIICRWLGAAGIEIVYQGSTLLIDPFFSRPPVWSLISGRRVAPNSDLVSRCVPRVDYVLVTHAHYDHLMDVPEVLRQTRSRAFGSPNTCAILARQGLPAQRISCIHVGDSFKLGPFEIEVFPAAHTRTPLDRFLSGPLPEDLRIPLRLTDYRMDRCYSFRIGVGGHTWLVGSHPVPAGTLFISPYHSPGNLRRLLEQIRPSQVIPIHWDDFTRPLSMPIRPMLITAAQGGPKIPPVGRLDLLRFQQVIQSLPGGIEVLVPDIFQSLEIGLT